MRNSKIIKATLKGLKNDPKTINEALKWLKENIIQKDWLNNNALLVLSGEPDEIPKLSIYYVDRSCYNTIQEYTIGWGLSKKNLLAFEIYYDEIKEVVGVFEKCEEQTTPIFMFDLEYYKFLPNDWWHVTPENESQHVKKLVYEIKKL